MSKQNQHPPPVEVESSELPAWLTSVLSLYSEFGDSYPLDGEDISPALRDRYRAAANIALSVAKLRKERERIGFVPLSLSDYIQGLVKVADISLTPMLDWFGIKDITRPDSGSARSFARLTRELGISLREALVHIRITFASQIDSAPILLLMARQRSVAAGHNTLDECESTLGIIESEYELDSLRELRRTEFEIHAAYKEHGSVSG